MCLWKLCGLQSVGKLNTQKELIDKLLKRSRVGPILVIEWPRDSNDITGTCLARVCVPMSLSYMLCFHFQRLSLMEQNGHSYSSYFSHFFLLNVNLREIESLPWSHSKSRAATHWPFSGHIHFPEPVKHGWGLAKMDSHSDYCTLGKGRSLNTKWGCYWKMGKGKCWDGKYP